MGWDLGPLFPGLSREAMSELCTFQMEAALLISTVFVFIFCPSLLPGALLPLLAQSPPSSWVPNLHRIVRSQERGLADTGAAQCQKGDPPAPMVLLGGPSEGTSVSSATCPLLSSLPPPSSPHGLYLSSLAALLENHSLGKAKLGRRWDLPTMN